MNVYESVNSYKIVHECIWKGVGVFEPIERYKKVVDSI